MTQVSEAKLSEGDPVKVSSSSSLKEDEINSQNVIVCSSSQSINSSNSNSLRKKSDSFARKRFEKRSKSIAESDQLIAHKSILATRKKSVAEGNLINRKSVYFKPEIVDICNVLSVLENPCEENLINVAKILAQLRHNFKNCSQTLQKFIRKPLNGIDVLFNLLRKSLNHSCNNRKLSSFAWSYLQLEVLNCIQEIMDSPIGIQQIIKDDTNYAEKLASGNCCPLS